MSEALNPRPNYLEQYGYNPTYANIDQGISGLPTEQLVALQSQYGEAILHAFDHFSTLTDGDPSHPGLTERQKHVLEMGAERLMRVTEEITTRDPNLQPDERQVITETVARSIRSGFDYMNSLDQLIAQFQDYAAEWARPLDESERTRAIGMLPIIEAKTFNRFLAEGIPEATAKNMAHNETAQYAQLLEKALFKQVSNGAHTASATDVAPKGRSLGDTEIDPPSSRERDSITSSARRIGEITDFLDGGVEQIAVDDRISAAAELETQYEAFLDAGGNPEGPVAAVAQSWIRLNKANLIQETEDSDTTGISIPNIPEDASGGNSLLGESRFNGELGNDIHAIGSAAKRLGAKAALWSQRLKPTTAAPQASAPPPPTEQPSQPDHMPPAPKGPMLTPPPPQIPPVPTEHDKVIPVSTTSPGEAEQQGLGRILVGAAKGQLEARHPLISAAVRHVQSRNNPGAALPPPPPTEQPSQPDHIPSAPTGPMLTPPPPQIPPPPTAGEKPADSPFVLAA